MLSTGSSLTQAYAKLSRSETSTRALERHEMIGNRNAHIDRVARLWTHLKAIGSTPCSMATAARIATELKGEHCFSASQTNAEVVRKRTADLMKFPEPLLECLGPREDPDGVQRDWYEVVR